MLVITYKDCEAAYAGIPGVETAHFNAVAGLDRYKDVAALIVIGRPLPSTEAVRPLVGALFEKAAQGHYETAPRGVWLRSGRKAAVKVTVHEDREAEIIRASICDDEVMQALGRGRGVNRTEINPLEVHLLSDVALPMIYDLVQSWDVACPDIVHEMLLAGLAVDAPADAARLHLALFQTTDQAEKAFQRAGFGGQNPIENTYREMAVKCAAYRRGGKGHGWQKAYWIIGTADESRALLEAAIGPVVEWVPEL